jgi:zinc transport system ATP-binding protein
MSTEPIIKVSNLTLHFGAFLALDNLNFEISHGAMVVIIGPNGGGKTTLIHTLLGLLKADSGEINILGHAPGKVPPRKLGYVPQVKLLDRSFPARALELVVTGLTLRWPWRITEEQKASALACMEQIGVAHLHNKNIAALSGGELQRVYLARSLVRKPQLLMLDEPGAGMDVSSGHEMYHILERYQKESGATVMMITHDWEGARFHASHALLLRRKLLDFGIAKEVAQQDKLLKLFGHAGHLQASHEGDAHA